VSVVDMEAGIPPREWTEIRGNGGARRYYVLEPELGQVWRRGSETIAEALERIREQKRSAPEEPARPKPKGRKPDPTPRVDGPKKKEKPRPTTKQLAQAVEVPLGLIPALVYLRTGCGYCRDEMNRRRAGAAQDLANMAATNPLARRALEAVYAVVSGVSGTENIGRFIGIPLIHHAAPEPIFEAVAPLLAMPPRPVRSPHVHEPPGAPAGVGGRPPSEADFMRWLAARRGARTNDPPYSATGAHRHPPMSDEQVAHLQEVKRREAARAQDPQAPPLANGAEAAGSPLPEADEV
jgi:hypothetical protein